MEVDVRIADDNSEAALFFPEPAPGYTIIVNAEQCEELIGILVDVRRLACCRFRGHRDKVFDGTGEWECKEGSSAASSSLRR